ncbi:hypothetical protein GH714_042799 [Hevea brasiliensis]|uniref:Coenzyme Q-binding protein COQ10 START domain-containing protein n=1 Tax=Hevea brasiliensis TaxID=3981 RepID=A0A6A6K0J5_HEVBR|nr:hypothetical protein GH714_042799 [Hevea brasiliensis]
MPAWGNRLVGEEVLAFAAEKLFSIVLDVERYPEFLPWCKDVRVISRDGSSLVAEVVAGFLSLKGGQKVLQVTFDVAADVAKHRIMRAFRARAYELFGAEKLGR